MRTGGAGAWVELDGGGHPGRCARAADRGRSVPLSGHVTILTGGVGGAKLVLGLCHAIPAGSVTAIVNTGDDFQHLGLSVSPDIDTLLYTLSGKANAAPAGARVGAVGEDPFRCAPTSPSGRAVSAGRNWCSASATPCRRDR